MNDDRDFLDVRAELVPEATPDSLSVKVESCIRTEMGIRLDIRSKVANMIIELDLEQNPEFFLGLLQVIPNIINDQFMRLLGEEDDDAPEHPPVHD